MNKQVNKDPRKGPTPRSLTPDPCDSLLLLPDAPANISGYGERVGFWAGMEAGRFRLFVFGDWGGS